MEIIEEIPDDIKPVKKTNKGKKYNLKAAYDIEHLKESKPAIYKTIKLKAENPNLTCREIAAATGRDFANVSRTLKKYGIASKNLTAFKSNRVDILAGLQERIIKSIDDETINKASLKDRSISIGIIAEKERLFDNKPTSITLAGIVEHIDKEERAININIKQVVETAKHEIIQD